MASTIKNFVMSATNPAGNSVTITVPYAKDNIDEDSLATVAQAFNPIGIAIDHGHYETVTKTDDIYVD